RQFYRRCRHDCDQEEGEQEKEVGQRRVVGPFAPTLECGALTPLSFFGNCVDQRKKESGVIAPHSKLTHYPATPGARAAPPTRCARPRMARALLRWHASAQADSSFSVCSGSRRRSLGQ